IGMKRPLTVGWPMFRAWGRAGGLCLLAGPLHAQAAADGTLSLRPFVGVPPSPIEDLVAAPGAQEGQVNLDWTSPGVYPGSLPEAYRLRVQTFSAADVGGSTEAWWNQPSGALFESYYGVPEGQPVARVVGPAPADHVLALEPGATYYFGVRSADDVGSPRGFYSRLSNLSTATAQDLPPAPPSNLAAAAGASSISLTWDGSAAADLWYYRIYIDSTAPYDFADCYATTAPAGSAGLEHSGLDPGSTYYYRVSAVDQGQPDFKGRALESSASNTAWALVLERPLPPVPRGLSARGGIVKAALSWEDTSGQVPDFRYWRLYRSTQAASDFISVTTTTALAYVDRFLAPFTTYYYRLAARDSFGGESFRTSTVSAVTYDIVPMEPLGVRAAPSADGSSVTFSWTPTRQWADGSFFDGAVALSTDELQGYRILRSTEACLPTFRHLSSAAVDASSFTSFTDGEFYYYQILAYNSQGPSTNTAVYSSLGEHQFFVNDCVSRLVIPEAAAPALSGETNALGVDVQIARRQREEDLSPQVYQSVEFRALREGRDEIQGFHFDQPVRVVLRYNAVGGVPAPMAAPAAGAKDLGIFWNNGAEFKKLYGKVDASAQTVTVETLNVGVFQIRPLYRSDEAVLDLSNLSSRVITPNGDGLNDVLIFTYDPGPAGVAPSGRIYDVKGAFVADMTPGREPNTLVWDGRMSGRPAAGGVYVYEIKGGGKTLSGTVVVAR
ncbi:MAG: hypothetical protein PHF00_04975, partial [Elusimicrobia bacterium]|nr:hypothetical protein [Elusimicrobiota bacterium]